MFVRSTKVKGVDKSYCYAQLVEAYRRADGQPRQRVIASLGKLTQLEVANLRVALKAAKAGVAVTQLTATGDAPVVHSSLDYLSIAVVLEMAKRIGLTSLLSRVLDDGNTSAPNSEVMLALVAQRLIAPGSKLASVDWFRRTALPDLLTISAAEFNNSRIHRVLNLLGQARPELQLGVAQLHDGSTQKGHALFIDVSDTWFEGRGPTVAQTAKTKEGAFKRKIGIVLTCNKKGLPVRWDVVEGRRADCKAMGDMATQLAAAAELSRLPMVFDRAMGKKQVLQDLTDAGVRFVTLMTSESFAGYAGEELDLPELDLIEPNDEEDVQARAAALDCVQKQGFKKIGRKLWGKSLNVRRYRKKSLLDPNHSRSGSMTRPHRKPARGSHPHVIQALRKAEEIQTLKQETGVTYNEVYAHFGIDRFKGYYLRTLLSLHPGIREAICDGQSCASLPVLKKIAALDPDEQLEAFAAFRLGSKRSEATLGEPLNEERVGLSGPPIKFVLAFDPCAFSAVRFKANERHRQLCEGVEAVSLRLVRRATNQLAAGVKIAKLLAKYSMTDCYQVVTTATSARLERREDIWQRKRRTDGFRLFAMHPDLKLSPKRVINLYSEKMAVEVDFHVIKSIVKIRPVHHSTEAKVRAHVDLCVLALAVERALNAALPKGLSTPAALEKLETVRLTSVAPNPTTTPTRVLTTPTAAQHRILEQLGMLDLTQLRPM